MKGKYVIILAFVISVLLLVVIPINVLAGSTGLDGEIESNISGAIDHTNEKEDISPVTPGDDDDDTSDDDDDDIVPPADDDDKKDYSDEDGDDKETKDDTSDDNIIPFKDFIIDNKPIVEQDELDGKIRVPPIPPIENDKKLLINSILTFKNRLSNQFSYIKQKVYSKLDKVLGNSISSVLFNLKSDNSFEENFEIEQFQSAGSIALS